MLTTVVTSETKTVEICHGKPITIIGEKLSAIGSKLIRKNVEKGNFDIYAKRAISQTKAGSHILDINATVPGIDEVDALVKATKTVMDTVDTPLCFDFGSAEALEAALSIYKGKALVNSINGEEEKLTKALPLVKKYDASFVLLPVDSEHGIARDAETRIKITKNIIAEAEKLGISKDRIILDGLVMGVATDTAAGPETFKTIMRGKEELGLNVTVGASNVSFGLPGRRKIDAYYLAMCIAFGVNCPISDASSALVKEAVYIADLLSGNDDFGMNYITFFREMEAAKEAAKEENK